MAGSDFSRLWARFRGKGGTERDRVIVGVAAAFAHVAAANSVLERTETTRFVDVVRGSRLAPADEATALELGVAFDELVQTLLASPAPGRNECLRVLSDFGFDPARGQIIWSATQAALVADSALDAAERVAESEIREALQIRPSRA